MKKLKLEIDVYIVEEFKDNKDTIARIHYPNEGNKITIVKGLNRIDLDDAISHEIGHLIDWYISNGNQSDNVRIREQNADAIGESINKTLKQKR